MTKWNKKYANMSLVNGWVCRDNTFMTTITNTQQQPCAVSASLHCELALVPLAVEGADRVGSEVGTTVAKAAAHLRHGLQTFGRGLVALARAVPKHSLSTSAVSAACTDGVRPPMP